ncbi:hypothetical protein BDN72DRAFT_63961 [Pluteus cervinus]|uniref:Uncharacterized protein n=1 Tax=Pluteus cervinus TaxID=181527 RepID=A0ACD3ARY4_9AGAR|nr:hypothetical protein BDN72DRAFT_63961 [Pluteus cervinus]
MSRKGQRCFGGHLRDACHASAKPKPKPSHGCSSYCFHLVIGHLKGKHATRRPCQYTLIPPLHAVPVLYNPVPRRPGSSKKHNATRKFLNLVRRSHGTFSSPISYPIIFPPIERPDFDFHQKKEMAQRQGSSKAVLLTRAHLTRVQNTTLGRYLSCELY